MELEELIKLNEEKQNEFAEWLKDKSVDLDTRWNRFKFAYTKLKFGKQSQRTNFGINRDDEFLYEGPLYMEKYETSSVFDILSDLEEDEDFAMTLFERVTFKEYCLKNFYSKMKFDW